MRWCPSHVLDRVRVCTEAHSWAEFALSNPEIVILSSQRNIWLLTFFLVQHKLQDLLRSLVRKPISALWCVLCYGRRHSGPIDLSARVYLWYSPCLNSHWATN